MVRIITDTASDFDKCEYGQLGVEMIPLIVSFGKDDYQETSELEKDRFYELLLHSKSHPKTAQPSPAFLADLLKEAKNNGDEVICICLSSGLSGFYSGALLSKELAEMEQCYIIDSTTATAGQRILVEYAVKLRQEGKTAQVIAEYLEKMKSRIALYACLDTLDYLYKGGRISKELEILGTVLGVKPIITVQNGTPAVIAKARGMKKGIRSICSMVEQAPPDQMFPIYGMYTHTTENGINLMEALKAERYPIAIKNFVNVGAAIGSHIGPNACGVVYVKQECSQEN